MSVFDPSGLALMNKNNGDVADIGDLKALVDLVKNHFNGQIGNLNYTTNPAEKLDWAKINATGQIQDGDIASISTSKFSSLKATAQSSPNNTVAVAAGQYAATGGLATRTFAGGNSPAFPNTAGAGLNRIDVLMIDDAGVLSRVVGAEAASPVAPAYDATKVPICEVFIRFNGGGVVIRNTDNGTDSYILLDARPFIKNAVLGAGSVTYETIASGAVGGTTRVFGTTDIADPGTAFVTMTSMSKTLVSPRAGMGILCLFQAPITRKQADAASRNLPGAEIRLMAGIDGAAVSQISRTIITGVGESNINWERSDVVSLFGLVSHSAAPTGNTVVTVEWRRVDPGTPGTPTIEQRGAALAPRELRLWGCANMGGLV